jgi:crotonobetainyl-CoA:carnitine CoA-transferase CaiB-like acyl-CoA transferase
MRAVEEARAATRDLAAARGRPMQVGTTPDLVAASFAATDHLRIDGRPAQGWAPLSGFVRTGDGWVRLHANYPHHAAAIAKALGVSTRDDLERAARDLTSRAVEDEVVAAGGIATVVRSQAAWAAHPHGTATASDPWYTEQLGAPRVVRPTSDLPLSGLRILDFTRVIAGPTCSQLLACLGADVLRVDPPQRPELLDQYISNGMGKRSAQSDLSTDLRVVRTELLPRADVVLLGYRPGSLARFGIDPDTLSADDSRLVIASLSAWGEHGPWGRRPGFDSIVQAATGIADVCSTADGHPGALPVQALDHATGYVLAARVISLLAREHGGIVRASLLGAARTLLGRGHRDVADELDLAVPTVSVGSPHGRLTAVPPPVVLDGATIERDVSGYATAALTWL